MTNISLLIDLVKTHVTPQNLALCEVEEGELF